MSDQCVKFGAAIQHFYEIAVARLIECETQSISNQDDLEKVIYREKSVELDWLLFEYSKTFKDILCLSIHEMDRERRHL